MKISLFNVMQKERILEKTLLLSIRYSKNNKYKILVFHITMLEKETTLNRVSHNSGLTSFV